MHPKASLRTEPTKPEASDAELSSADLSSTSPALWNIIAPICQAHGVEPIDARFAREPRGPVLRVLIERPEAGDAPYRSGVDLADCAAVSHDLSAALEVQAPKVPHGLLSAAFHLEVSSPGVERPLLRRQDFLRFSQQAVFVRSFSPIDGQRNFHGTLLGVEGDEVRLRCDAREVSVPLDQIAKAHLIFPTPAKRPHSR